jgi:hypothetical protein
VADSVFSNRALPMNMDLSKPPKPVRFTGGKISMARFYGRRQKSTQ